MSDFKIREATREDCKRIHELIQELANFENLPDGPKIGPEVLARDGFDREAPLFKCIVAEMEKSEKLMTDNDRGSSKLVGYALYFYSYSTWFGPSLYLEDIYVTPEVRSTGVGSALFDQVVKVACETGCCRLDFVVLSWNPATEFYKRKGAVDLTESEKWHHYRLDKKALEDLYARKFSE